MSELSDGRILSLVKKETTRNEGLTLLMDSHKERIYWHIRRLVVNHEDAEDILQETFIKAFSHIGSFSGKSRLYTWLFRIATNECIRFFRKNKRKRDKLNLHAGIMPEMVFHDTGTSGNILMKFQEAILLLPERQRIVFNLRYYDELGYDEISQVLGSSVNAVKTNYHYASEKVKDYLLNHG